MKLADRTVEIHSRGLESSNQFTIAQTSKMFKILSDSLYSDKVMAVIRELSTNAYDAHVAAGNKNPFKIILPTQAVPSFTVRDYGTGLSQQDMEELYTTYGASNKNDSNDFVGCLGLGSKSPFAYTKSFSTVSYYNGTKYSYIAAMDENGVPSLNLFDISPTKEPNGLEISFAVKQCDFGEFTTKAKRIFHYFKMKPIIEGGFGENLSDHSYSYTNFVIDGKGWRIGRLANNNDQYPSAYNNADSGIVAIMGNIAYPVDSSKIIGEAEKESSNDAIQKWNRTFKKVDVDNWKNLVKEVLGSGLYLEINFDIGELEMDVSREGLQYTKNVIKVLRERTQDIYLQLKEDMTQKITQCTNLVDAYQTYYNLSDLAGGWTAGASWTDQSGKTHELTSGKDLEYKFKKNKQLYVFNFRTSGYRSRRMVYLTDKIHNETLKGVPQYYWSGTKKSGKMIFFRCDIKGEETAKKIVTKYCNQNDCFAYLMVDSSHPEDSTEGFDDIISDIGGETNVVNVSDYRSLLSKGPRKSSVSFGQISAGEVFIIGGCPDANDKLVLSGNGINDSDLLREVDEDIYETIEDQDETIYIPIIRYASVEGFPSIAYLNKIIKDKNHTLHNLLKDKNILAIKQSAVSKIKDLNLVDFNAWIKPQLKSMMSKLCGEVGSYKNIVDYCTEQYNADEKNETYGYYRIRADRHIAVTILSIFGIDYHKYIGGSELCNLVDQWMIHYFFAHVIHNSFDMKFCKKSEYFAVMTKILAKHNMNGIDPEKIRKQTQEFNILKSEINTMYSEDYTSKIVSISQESKDFCESITKSSDLRKNFKAEVDKVPMLKYIVSSTLDGTSADGGLNGIGSSNPLRVNHNRYYTPPAWFVTIDENGIEQLRNSLSVLIK
jgi:hypothetical protein